MKLDVNVLRYLSKDEFRVLTAVEMGEKNHELVPTTLIDSIAGLRRGGTFVCLQNLLRNKLVHHENRQYDGYRLTYMGYDYLAIKTLLNRGQIVSVGRQIGVGKESDIFEVANDKDEILVLKLHRLGRTSFRSVKKNRDYLRGRGHYSWLFLSRLSALKEFAFMKALEEHGFPVPRAIDHNRHAVLMSKVEGKTMIQVRKMRNPAAIYDQCMDLISRLASVGLIHCDFNEFNVMLSSDHLDDEEEEEEEQETRDGGVASTSMGVNEHQDDLLPASRIRHLDAVLAPSSLEKLTMIDFPQMVSVKHANAESLFDRDVDCIVRFFGKKMGYHAEDDPRFAEKSFRPNFSQVAGTEGTLDAKLSASGFKKEHQKVLEREMERGDGEEGEEDEEGEEGEEEEEGEEGEGVEAVQEAADDLTLASEDEESDEGSSNEDEDEEGDEEEGGDGAVKKTRRRQAASQPVERDAVHDRVLIEKRRAARRDAMNKATRNANKKGSGRQKQDKMSGW